MSRQAVNVVKNEDGTTVKPISAKDCEKYLKEVVKRNKSGSNDKYFGLNGFASTQTVRDLPPDTIGYLMLTLYLAIMDKIHTPEMQTVYNAVNEFVTHSLTKTHADIKTAEANAKIAAIAAGAGLKIITELENQPQENLTESVQS